METQRSTEYASLHRLTRGSLGLLWLYQGFVPKIVRPSSETLEVLTLAGIDGKIALDLLYGIGLVEIALGLTLLSGPRWRWPLWLNLVLVAVYVLGTATVAPKYLLSAYSPAALGLLIAVLSIVALRTFSPRSTGKL